MAYVTNYWEVNSMPKKDGTGPMTDRGLGPCTGANTVKYRVGLRMGLGLGLSCRCGYGRGFSISNTSSKTKKELLQE